MKTRHLPAHGLSLVHGRNDIDGPETSVLVVGNRALIREGLTLALKHAAPTVPVLTEASLDDALAALQGGASVRLVVLDLSSVEDQEVQTLQWFTRQIRPVATAVMFDELDALTMNALHEGGIRGLISMHSGLIDVERALRRVLQGGIYWPDTRAAHARACNPVAGCSAKLTPCVGLTSRQKDVLGLLTRGLSNKQISKELGLAMSTTKAHLSAIFRCLEVDSRAQAIVEAKHRGWNADVPLSMGYEPASLAAPTGRWARNASDSPRLED